MLFIYYLNYGAYMSLIIAYVGKKGCVMASDKRRIAYFGDKENREILEEELYDGSIITDNDLYNRASELDITLKINDDATKVRDINNVAVGEVSSKGTMETKRKRIYGTTNGFQIVELTGSEITDVQKGEASIILFGNKITKSLANEFLGKRWKPNFSLKYMGEIFGEIIQEIANKTPSLGKGYDVTIVQANFNKNESQIYLDETIERDVKLLGKIRNKLQEELVKQSENIKLASKIIEKGSIGKIDSIEGNLVQVKLNSNVQAFDSNWKQLVKPNNNAIMFLEDGKSAKVGDEVVIENETLCVKGNNTLLMCDIILCNL